MKLFLIKPKEETDARGNTIDPIYWRPWYDKCFGMVIRAENEQSARKWASEDSETEGPEGWLDPECSDCIELPISGDAETILKDIWRA